MNTAICLNLIDAQLDFGLLHFVSNVLLAKAGNNLSVMEWTKKAKLNRLGLNYRLRGEFPLAGALNNLNWFPIKQFDFLGKASLEHFNPWYLHLQREVLVMQLLDLGLALHIRSLNFTFELFNLESRLPLDILSPLIGLFNGLIHDLLCLKSHLLNLIIFLLSE